MPRRRAVLGLSALALLAACAALPSRDAAPPLTADALATALASAPVVLLGEVHDNAVQHRVRAEALRRLVASGARPALAFEQFDRGQQAELDRARSQGVDAVLKLGARGWDWPLYRPFVELAIAHELPIVAANLSRAEASRVGREGYGALFDNAARERLGLDRVPAEVLAEHRRTLDDGHCGLLPASALDGLVRAQVARDAVLADALRPHLARGVVLLTGNGHARNDLGVPRYLAPEVRARTVTIGLLEEGVDHADLARRFDRAFVGPLQPRSDPCETLRRRPGPDPQPAQPEPASGAK